MGSGDRDRARNPDVGFSTALSAIGRGHVFSRTRRFSARYVIAMAPSRPVSVVIDREVLPGKKPEFEASLRGIIEASSRFPGYLGTDVLYPEQPDDHDYRVVFRYESPEQLAAWEASEERARWLDRLDKLIAEPAKLRVICGLETWFAQPRAKSIVPPPRHKMAVVTWLAITPLLIVMGFATAPFLGDLPSWARILATTPIVVLIMTYGVMPFMVKRFAGWLYPQREPN